MIAYVIAIAFPFPGMSPLKTTHTTTNKTLGFVGSLGANVSTTATRMGDLGWILSFTTGFICYYIICTFWPTENQRIIKEQGYTWEQTAKDDNGEFYLNGANVGGVTCEEVIMDKGAEKSAFP